MTPLRQRMTNDMTVHGLAESTKQSYLNSVSGMYSFLCCRYSVVGAITRNPQWRHQLRNHHVLAEEHYFVTLGAASCAVSDRVPEQAWSEGVKAAYCVYVVVGYHPSWPIQLGQGIGHCSVIVWTVGIII